MERIERHFVTATRPTVSQEAETDGKTRVEREIVVFGKIADFGELAKADRVEKQEQWEVRPKETGTKFQGGIRIRCTSDTKYVLTFKTYQPNVGDLVETETELDPVAGKSMMNELKKLTASGMIKVRHYFKVPDSDLTWEVDVYFDEQNRPLRWCKIDLEVPSMDIARPELPVRLLEAREIPPKNRTEEEQAFVENLMSNEFLTPSPHAV